MSDNAWFVLLALAAVGVYFLVQRFRSPPASFERIPVTELGKRRKDADTVLLDVRTPGEFASGHVAGAINLPLDRITADPSVANPYKERTLLLICRSGARSSNAAGVLSRAGFRVVNVDGGTTAWAGTGRPLET